MYSWKLDCWLVGGCEILKTEGDHAMSLLWLRVLFLLTKYLFKFCLVPVSPGTLPGIACIGKAGSSGFSFCIGVVLFIDVGEVTVVDIKIFLESQTNN